MECTTFSPPQTTPAARTRILSILCSCHHVKNRKSRHPHAGRAARHPFKRMTGWLDERDLRGGQGRPTGNTDVLGSFQVHYVLAVLSISDVGFRVGSFRSEIQCPRGLIHASRPSCRPDIMLLCWPGLMSVSVCGITHFLLVKWPPDGFRLVLPRRQVRHDVRSLGFCRPRALLFRRRRLHVPGETPAGEWPRAF